MPGLPPDVQQAMANSMAMQAQQGQVPPPYMQQMLRADGVPEDKIAQPMPQAAPPPPQAPSLTDPGSQPENQHPIGIDGEGLDTAPQPEADGDVGTSADPLRMADGTEDTALLPDGTADRDRISQAMSESLALKLEENPKSVSNPQLYDVSQNPLAKAQLDASLARTSQSFNPNAAQAEEDDMLPAQGNMPEYAGGVPQKLDLNPNDIPSVGDVMTQGGFVPGMLSTIQTGSTMHSWGHGSSRRL